MTGKRFGRSFQTIDWMPAKQADRDRNENAVRKTSFRRNDFVFAGAVLLAAFAVWLLFHSVYGKEGARVQIRQNGEVYAEYSLAEDREVRIADGASGGSNVLVVKSGRVYVSEADCPDKLCVEQKSISRTGESIVCLPHKLVITITGGEEAAYDGFAQ